MRRRTFSWKRSLGTSSRYLGLVLILLAVLGPYVVMLLTSLTPRAELAAAGASLIPKALTLDAYVELISTTPFLTYLRNSFLVALMAVPITLVCATGAAIALSRFEFIGRRQVMTALILAQMLPAVLLVLSLQQQLNVLGLLDSKVGLALVHSAFATPFATWLLKGFLDGIPRELEESGQIDGASSWQIIRLLLLPLLLPGMVAAGTYAFILTWNEFLYALTFTASPATRTLPVGLQLFIGEYQIRWELLTAGGVLSVLPVVAGFLLVQRRLVAGLAAGAVKG
ncbi:carbohydrate ABC transporter permease [Tessaracoccus sp. OS52]|uniref:carbohydrate ABC transporter permease n=1 Tax=Tessaracoccus sp. OS52 TaxID=2886691 RepID=UPI001D11C662|nr:carbohydrate ABC transporter permease [Tessaracoccus sp. OS52]MCC2594314.1 carbohydrate ABC transporter permease [Tessaracoccus sp. OS52]